MLRGESWRARRTLAAHVENLTLTGTGGISGTGNELDNVLTGNNIQDRLSGGAGARPAGSVRRTRPTTSWPRHESVFLPSRQLHLTRQGWCVPWQKKLLAAENKKVVATQCIFWRQPNWQHTEIKKYLDFVMDVSLNFRKLPRTAEQQPHSPCGQPPPGARGMNHVKTTEGASGVELGDGRVGCLDILEAWP